MRNLLVMFVTAFCFLFLLKLKWPKTRTFRKKGAQKNGGWKFTHFTSPGSAPAVVNDSFNDCSTYVVLYGHARTYRRSFLSNFSIDHGYKIFLPFPFLAYCSHSQWPNPSSSDLNTIFPGKKQANHNFHFISSWPLIKQRTRKG